MGKIWGSPSEQTAVPNMRHFYGKSPVITGYLSIHRLSIGFGDFESDFVATAAKIDTIEPAIRVIQTPTLGIIQVLHKRQIPYSRQCRLRDPKSSLAQSETTYQKATSCIAAELRC